MPEVQEIIKTTTYSAADVLTFIAAFGVLITGAGAVIVNIIVALKTTHKIDENISKTAAVSEQVKEVHTLTNSNLSAVKNELSLALSQITSLNNLVRELQGERRHKQLEKAYNTPVPTGKADAAVIEETLEKIEENTAEIDKNTKSLGKAKK